MRLGRFLLPLILGLALSSPSFAQYFQAGGVPGPAGSAGAAGSSASAIKPGWGVATNSSTVIYITLKGSNSTGAPAIAINIGGVAYAQTASQALTYTGLTASTWYHLYASNLGGATTTAPTFYITPTAPALNGTLGAAPGNYTYMAPITVNASHNITAFLESGGYFLYRGLASTNGVCSQTGLMNGVLIGNSVWTSSDLSGFIPPSADFVLISGEQTGSSGSCYSPDGKEPTMSVPGNGCVEFFRGTGQGGSGWYYVPLRTLFLSGNQASETMYVGVCGFRDLIAASNGLQ